MRIVINDQVTIYDSPISTYYFDSVDGLHTPDYRTYKYTNSGIDGGRVPKQLYGHRVFEINGGIDGNNCQDMLQARQDLIAALSFDEYVPLQFFLDDGRALTSFVKFEKPELDFTSKFYSSFTLVAIADRPEMLDTSTGSSNTIDVEKSDQKGWLVSPSGWVISNDGWVIIPGAGAVNAQNLGSSTAYPTIWIKGEVQNPVITNLTTGDSLTISITTSASDEIKIDTRFKAVLLNGGNINANAFGSYPTLAPGNNLFEFENTLGNGYAVVEWFNSYMSI